VSAPRWGWNEYGKLGLTASNVYSIAVGSFDNEIVMIATERSHPACIDTQGELNT